MGKPEVAKYCNLPVYSDIPKAKAKRIMAKDEFVKCADSALSQVRDWWQVEPVGLVLENVGAVALTRCGDRLLVRFEKAV